MKKLALVPVVLLAACAGGRRPGEPALLTLLGREGRLETWESGTAENGHLHPRQTGPCPSGIIEAGAHLLGDPDAERIARRLAEATETFTSVLSGPPVGGPGKLTLALRRFPPDGDVPREGVFVVVPALPPGTDAKTFGPPELSAEYHRPAGKVEARLESGRAHVVRLGPGRYEFELFLVLRPAERGAGYERLQVVARVEASGAR